MKRKKTEDEDFDKVINTILRYPHGGLVDIVGGEVLSPEELQEYRDELYGSYGLEERVAELLSLSFIDNLLELA